MTSSTGKIIGLVLLALIILALAWPLKVLFFAPSAAFSGLFHDRPFRFEHWNGWHWSILGVTGLTLAGLAILALIAAILVWVYRDAEQRGMNGLLWTAVVFFGHLVGLIIYLVVRSDHPIKPPAAAGLPVSPVPPPPPQCRQCGKIVDRNHAFCPYCGARTQTACPKCAKAIEKGWLVCPNCGEKL